MCISNGFKLIWFAQSHFEFAKEIPYLAIMVNYVFLLWELGRKIAFYPNNIVSMA